MRESPAEASVDSQNGSKPQTADTSQNSNSETDPKTFAEIDSTPRFRKGPLFLTQILGLDVLVLEIQLLFT